MESDHKELYEIAFHLSPILSEGEVNDAASAIRKEIEAKGGSITIDEAPKQYSLQYRLTRSRGGKREHSDSSHFGHMRFEANQETIPDIQKNIQAMHPVLRMTLVRIEPHKLVTRSRPAQFRSVLAKEGEEAAVDAVKEEVPGEELDKEIEKLVVE